MERIRLAIEEKEEDGTSTPEKWIQENTAKGRETKEKRLSEIYSWWENIKRIRKE